MFSDRTACKLGDPFAAGVTIAPPDRPSYFSPHGATPNLSVADSPVSRHFRTVKAVLLILPAVLVTSCTSLTDAVFKASANSHSPANGAPNELVMTPGMSITARTRTGTVTVTAGHGLKRTYAWEGASRSATLWPRSERWYGSLGAYHPAPFEPWREHHGITRGVVEEGQQHFYSENKALAWIRQQIGFYPTVYRNDGLLVSFGKVLERRQINVEVWQLFIRGRKPHRLPGSQNTAIQVSTESSQ